MQAAALAAQNFETCLRQNSYPGRGIVIGRSDADEWIIVYWIMGRSVQSRNRRFVAEGSTLRTEPVDASLLTDPSLIIYEAMLDLPGIYLVTNGDQTRTVYDALQNGGTFESALLTREREPDAPNFTPRISGMLDLRTDPNAVTLSILKANLIDPAFTDHFTFHFTNVVSGYGYGITTYDGDGSPLPSFAGTPLLLPLPETPEKIMDFYWDALNADNRVALAVKRITPNGATISIRNRE
jgi:IMP cyclohydrolase